MASYSTISNAALAVGAIPSSSVVTALRDNPLAIAETSTGAPINVIGWHPVAKVTVGDAQSGIVYDSSISGTVASVETPNFEDGYEYRMYVDGLSHNNATARNFRISLYQQTSAAYALSYVSASTITSAQVLSAEFDILLPRLVKTSQILKVTCIMNNVLDTNTIGVISGSEKILKVKLDFTVGSIDAGKVYLFRRREFASLA